MRPFDDLFQHCQGLERPIADKNEKRMVKAWLTGLQNEKHDAKQTFPLCCGDLTLDGGTPIRTGCRCINKNGRYGPHQSGGMEHMAIKLHDHGT
jgi:hypothetical protein